MKIENNNKSGHTENGTKKSVNVKITILIEIIIRLLITKRTIIRISSNKIIMIMGNNNDWKDWQNNRSEKKE